MLSYLKYPLQAGCTLSGPEILNRLKRVVSEIQNPPKFTIGTDDSFLRMQLSDGSVMDMNLAKYTIFKRGESFYNQHGFYGDYYSNERDHNDRLRRQPIVNFYGRDNTEILLDAFGINADLNTVTIKQIAEAAADTLKKSKYYTPEQAFAISELINDVPFIYNKKDLLFEKNMYVSLYNN
jgi:hypothetical protein